MAFLLLRAQPVPPNPSTTCLELITINGQPMLTFEDETRADKRLSVSEQVLTFSATRLNHNDWVTIGNAVGADSSFVADFDGTVTSASGHCTHTNSNSKEIHLFVNGVDNGTLSLLTGGPNATFINNTLNVDFTRGDTIRLQARDGIGGSIRDTVVKLSIKWRV